MNLKQWIMWMVFTCFTIYGTYVFMKPTNDKMKRMTDEEWFFYLEENGKDYVHQTMFGLAWALVICSPMMIEYFTK